MSFIKDTTHTRLLRAVDKAPMTVKHLASRAGVTERRVRQLLKEMFETGSVYRTYDRPPKYGRTI